MSSRPARIILCLFFLSGNGSLAAEHSPAASMNYQGRTPFDIEQLKEEVQSEPGANVATTDELVLVEVPGRRTMYYFTREGHPRHSSVVIRSVVVEGENVVIKTTGYTSGDRKLFEKWLEQFTRQDRRIKQDFN